MKAKFTLSAIIPLALGLLFTPSFSNAQGCHNGIGNSIGNMRQMPDKTSSDNLIKYAAHRGSVNPIGKYYVEMVYDVRLAKDPIIFYLMSKKGKPISDEAITGKAEYTYPDGSNSVIILEPRGENGFSGPMPNKTASFICLLTLNIDGKNVTTRFDYALTGQENISAASFYTCSMHPEVKSVKPGDCSKCGMSLVKKSIVETREIAMFQCPMKCEGDKIFDIAGKCAKCGMELTDVRKN